MNNERTSTQEHTKVSKNTKGSEIHLQLTRNNIVDRLQSFSKAIFNVRFLDCPHQTLSYKSN